jgi:hypothetical protein
VSELRGLRLVWFALGELWANLRPLLLGWPDP